MESLLDHISKKSEGELSNVSDFLLCGKQLPYLSSFQQQIFVFLSHRSLEQLFGRSGLNVVEPDRTQDLFWLLRGSPLWCPAKNGGEA